MVEERVVVEWEVTNMTTSRIPLTILILRKENNNLRNIALVVTNKR